MKPAHERNQECLPPKKRDLNSSTSSSSGAGGGMGGCGGGGGGGGEEVASVQSSGVSGDSQGGGPAVEWLRAQPGLHYGVESAEGIQGLPVDQYSMLYKVALPSVSYSQASLHPVLSHISSAYTVPSSLLQHPGLPYPPLGYAQIPHSSFQFVTSPYGAVPYAVSPGFVPSTMISPSGTLSQPHLVPYQSVIQEGVVSPPPQAQVSAHAFAKVGSSGGVPMMLTSEPVAQHQQHLSVLPTTELSPRGVPVFYHPQGTRAVPPPRDPYTGQQETDREVNGGEREHSREMLQESVYMNRNARPLQTASASVMQEQAQDRSLKSRRLDERASPGQRSTPDTDLEVQQVVGRLASPIQGGGRKEVSFGPLNLSQGSQRGREAHGEAGGRTSYAVHPAVYGDPRAPPHQQQAGQPGHAVFLANGQPVLVPLDYPHHQLPPHHYPGQPNDTPPPVTMTSPTPHSKPPEHPARACLPDRAVAELAPVQHPAPSNPSHFMKGAIIQLATGELKRVEDLQTQDFVRSAEVSGGLKIDSSMVVDIRAIQQRPGLVALHFTVGEQQSKVTIDVPLEHPFFVFGQGWSSCSPERTSQLYGLACHHLQVGDVCVSVALQPPAQQQPPPSQASTYTKANSAPGVVSQAMGPPAPQQPRTQPHYRTERLHRDREKGERDEAVQVGGAGRSETPPRPNRTSAEHARSQSSYYLHTEGPARAGAGPGAGPG
ncbi:ataxin-1-like, partial [Esox lucius]